MSKSVVYNSSITVIRQVLGIIIGMFAAMIIARTLGVDGQGKYALIILLPNILYTLFDLGLPAATVYYIGKDEFSLKNIFKTNILLALLLSMITIFLGVIFIYLFHQKFYSDITFKSLFLILSVLPFMFFNKNLLVIFQGKEQFEKFNIVVIINQLGLLIFSVLFLVILELALTGAILAFILTQFFMLAVSMYYLHNEFKLNIFKGNFSFNYCKDSLVYGLKGHLSNVMAFLNYRVDLFIIAYFLNDYSVGLYSIAVTIVERLWVVSQSVSSVLFARVSNISSLKEKANFTSVVARNVLFLSTLGGILFYFLGEIIIKILFGNEFIDSIEPFVLLIPGVILLSTSRIISNYFSGMGKPEINTYVAFFTTFLNISLNIYFVPLKGISGAAIATSITYSINMIIKAYIFKRINKITFSEFLFIKYSDFLIYKSYLFKYFNK